MRGADDTKDVNMLCYQTPPLFRLMASLCVELSSGLQHRSILRLTGSDGLWLSSCARCKPSTVGPRMPAAVVGVSWFKRPEGA